MVSRFKRLAVVCSSVGAGAYLTTWFLTGENPFSGQPVYAATPTKVLRAKRPLPPRDEQIKSLQSGTEFDVLIIGGGATGAGCALDAVTRGLKTALVELDDFASGTSSRSTKLIHGGVRYLQKAILNLDIEQYRMVKEALHERTNMLTAAPHLTHPLPIMLPVYKWWQVPYYWVGIKAYDIVAGSKTVKSSYYVNKENTLELFPMLRGDKLCGAIVYYDGQQDDARMCLAIALTATRHGATVANHVRVCSLIKNAEGKCCGAHLRDELTGKEWDVKAKSIINATGPFTDSIRKMDDAKVKEICCPSSGVHIVLPGYYSPAEMGLLDPATSDGRVIFFLPWQRNTIAGTTDLPCDVTHHPKPTEDEIQFILTEVKNYLNPDVEVRRGDVLSAWSGIRPLVSDPNKSDTQSLARNHIVHVSPSNLVTIAGGKWTTYRAMAAEAVDATIKACNLKPAHMECQTDGLLIEGAHGWTPTMYIRLVQDFGLETEVAKHLSNSYGDRAFAVAKLAALTGKRWPIIGKRIHPEFPYIDAEIRYGVREYAMSAIDMIARRLRLSFLNVQAAQEALPGIIDIMAEELKWSEAEKKKQFDMAVEFLQNEMGQMVNRASRDKIPINLTKDEIQLYIKRFSIIDKESKGYVSINDIRRGLKDLRLELTEEEVKLFVHQTAPVYPNQVRLEDYIQNFGEADVPGEELHEILREIDTNMNGQVELDEYLQMMSAIKSGHVAYSRFARMAEMEHEQHEKDVLKKKISVERSGACNLKPAHMECQTDGLLIEGAHGWTPTMYIRLVQDFGLETEVAKHLSNSYGDRAFAVAKLAALTGKRWPIIGKRIHPEFPYIDAEIRYGVREYAMSAIDMIARRLRLSFLNVQAAQEALPGIIDIMAEELKWSEAEKKKQFDMAVEFLQNEMGQMVNRASRDKIPINLTKDEIQLYIKRFSIIDKESKGYVSINDIRRGLKDLRLELTEEEVKLFVHQTAPVYPNQVRLEDYIQNFGEADVPGEELHEILREIDTNMNGQVELDEYLQMMSAIKSGHVAYSRFARMAEMEHEQHEKDVLKKKISVERSGGGL